MKDFAEFKELILEGELGKQLAKKAIQSFNPVEKMDTESYLTSFAVSAASTLSLYLLEEYHKWLHSTGDHQA